VATTKFVLRESSQARKRRESSRSSCLPRTRSRLYFDSYFLPSPKGRLTPRWCFEMSPPVCFRADVHAWIKGIAGTTAGHRFPEGNKRRDFRAPESIRRKGTTETENWILAWRDPIWRLPRLLLLFQFRALMAVTRWVSSSDYWRRSRFSSQIFSHWGWSLLRSSTSTASQRTLHVAGTLDTDSALQVSLAIAYLLTSRSNIVGSLQAPARPTITTSSPQSQESSRQGTSHCQIRGKRNLSVVKARCSSHEPRVFSAA